MSSLTEWRSIVTDGTLNLYDATVKVLNKFPWCIIAVNLKFSQNSGSISDQQGHQTNTNISAIPVSLILNFRGLPVTMGEPEFIDDFRMSRSEFEIKAILPIEAINFIESLRSDDITLECHLSLIYREEGNLNKQQWFDEGRTEMHFSLNYSEKKWLKLLSEMGYSDKWVIELDRPKLEGFESVVEHVRKAQDALYNSRENEDVLRDLRSARDSFKVFFEANWDKISEIIDKGSQGEQNQKSKSQRVKEIYDKITFFLNIGPHNDKYEVTYADAQLAFREFVSMLSYLSSAMSQVKDDNNRG